MQDSIITSNIISQSYRDKKIINVLFKSTNSLMDQIFFESKNINFFDQKYIQNSIVNYDCLLTCDPLEHSSIVNKFKPLHIKNIVYIIYDYPNFLKKEDRFLLQNQIVNTYKLIASSDLQQTWNLANSQLLPYGIPANQNISNLYNKDVLVLNLDNNPAINNIFGVVKQSFANSDILHNIFDDMDLQKIYQIFSNYKVIIDLHSIVNGLVALESGSYLITNKEYLTNDGAFILKDVNTLIQDIKTLLESENKVNERQVSAKYNFDKFESKLTQNILQFISEPFIYE